MGKDHKYKDYKIIIFNKLIKIKEDLKICQVKRNKIEFLKKRIKLNSS